MNWWDWRPGRFPPPISSFQRKLESRRGGAAGASVPHWVAIGSFATTYGPCSITICKRAGQITLKSEQLRWEDLDAR